MLSEEFTGLTGGCSCCSCHLWLLWLLCFAAWEASGQSSPGSAAELRKGQTHSEMIETQIYPDRFPYLWGLLPVFEVPSSSDYPSVAPGHL